MGRWWKGREGRSTGMRALNTRYTLFAGNLERANMSLQSRWRGVGPAAGGGGGGRTGRSELKIRHRVVSAGIEAWGKFCFSSPALSHTGQLVCDSTGAWKN